ncbi:hypothetical protein CBR_g27849 [Chara braunii]|uniref:Integrase catalytic domain-containing protein n=1 Tax=Chara braunii TaxID=69332 RepID=A0A388L8W3_CHABU|nr:hypothetical protein CBR_g27849 [Chara braunii]|eukprot:GBG78623.1 hypothetical protein CBR_g27849 [Chara braunii]
MLDADGIERDPAATPEDFVKAIEKRELARLQVSKVDIFLFEGKRVSKWLELLEQITGEASDGDKFKFLPRYVWWEIWPEIMKVAAGARGDWAKFKGEMQRRFKLGDGLLTKADLKMLQRDEFTTVGAFATAFEKMARKVPGMAEEEQCATILDKRKDLYDNGGQWRRVEPHKEGTCFAFRDENRSLRQRGLDGGEQSVSIHRDRISSDYGNWESKSGHRSANATYLKIHELYYWDGMGQMIDDYCKSCVPCQERSSLRPREPLHPRYVREVGAVVHLDLLAMPLGIGSYNFIFNARDNLSGFVDGWAIRTKTGETLAQCIEEYYLHYPFVSRFVMDRGSEFTCAEVKTLLKRYGVIAEYTTAAHPQANAPVERGHSTITNLLVKWTDGRPNQWPNFLRVSFSVDNIIVRRSTGYALATLWYGKHATFLIESFLKTWRRRDLETNLTFEELPDSRARQIGAIEDKIEEAASRVADNRTKDKFRLDTAWGSHAKREGKGRASGNPFGGDQTEDADEGQERGHTSIELFVIEFERHAQEFGWDGTKILREVRGTSEWVEPIARLVRESLSWQDCEREMEGLHPSPVGRDGQPIRFNSTNLGEFLWAYDRYADDLNVPGEKRMGSFLLTQREDRRKEDISQRHEREGGSSGPGMLSQHAQMDVDCPMPDKEPDSPHEPQMQECKEDQTAEEKERDMIERAAREKEIRVQFRLKNLAEMNERMQQGEEPVVVKDKSGRSGEHHQEMGFKLVSTDLLNLRGVMKEGFAAAKASDQKAGERLTKVAQEVYGQRVDWEKEVEDLKKGLERQSKEMEPVKADMVEIRAENEAVRQVNQTLNKVNDVLRAYLQAQQFSFQAKEAEWEKRIQDLEARYTRQTPTAVVDWTEVQGFEIRGQTAEDAFKCQKEEEKVNQQEGEEIPLIDKEMLEPQEALTGKDAEGEEFEWRMPVGLTLGQEPVRPEERPPGEAMRSEVVPPTTLGEVVRQQEVQESMGQTMVGAELGVDPRGCQESTIPQDMPLVAGLRDALGSWATGSGPEGRVGEQVAQTDNMAACPTFSKVPQQCQQEVTSKVTTAPLSVPSQEGDKVEQKKVGRCFYCKKGKHLQEECPKSLKDEAKGLFTWDSSGVRRDRNENLILKTRGGIQAQLYRQL